MGEFARLAAEPSDHQKDLWWHYIAMRDEPVLIGATYIWVGWCPLCDDDKDEDCFTARFDFRRGLLYCENGQEGRACHGKRSISLSNVLVRMGTRG